MGKTAANGAGISFHTFKAQAAAAKDAGIGSVHCLIGLIRGGFVQIKAVAVLHNEFPAANETEARSYFVPEFRLNLIEIEGQLAVGMHFPAHQVGNNLFVGWTKTVIPVMAIFEPQEFFAIDLPAARFLPEFRGLDRRQQDFLGAGPVHFFSNN